MDTIFSNTEKNPRGIPKAPFVERVTDFVKDENDFTMVFDKFQERLAMYRYMQDSKTANIKQLQTRVPEIENTLKVCQRLKSKVVDKHEEVELQYQLNDTLYTTAVVDRPLGDEDFKVGLWLGADIMLEYPLDEAIELLNSRLEDSKASLQASIEDSEFLRENITTMEVNCARLYNWDVERRLELKRAEEGTKNLKI